MAMTIFSQAKQIVVWDLPVRVFHWLLVLSFTVAWITFDDDRYLFVHVYAGYVFFSLLCFRLIWGMFGTRHAKFRAFAYDWVSVSEYLKGLLSGRAARFVGHNPAGSWAIFLMLILGIIVSVAGLVTFGGEEGHGPLAGLVSFDIGSIYAREIHEKVAWAMLFVVGIHVSGVILESAYHHENLIWSMITGKKDVQNASGGVKSFRFLGLMILTGALFSSLVYFKGYLTETADDLYQPFQGAKLPDNQTWRTECADCHLAFHPTLLPKRSWQLLFDKQQAHFDEELDLDEPTIQELLSFHLENAAESGLTEAANKISRSLKSGDVPIRITETPYWVEKHADIPKKYWQSEKITSKSQCEACHLDAEKGTFEDSAMHLPDL